MRHFAILASFVLFVLLPVSVAGIYLWARAADQYASTVGFSVRKEEASSAIELLGGITDLSGSSSSDTDILYEFIQSQQLVAQIDQKIDLRKMWSKPENDPYFSYDASGTIEDLLDHWKSMVRISYDSGTGLMEIRSLAFDPDDAQKITTEVFEQSTAMINALSDVAREDTLRYTQQELDESVEQLKQARQVVTEFRNRNQLVDPEADLQSQATLLGSLQSQLAETLIEVEMLRGSTRADDPRLDQGSLRIEVIREQINEERKKLGFGSGEEGQTAFANIVGEYERLIVDREIAEATYAAARASHEASLAEARRQSRYLAAHVLPTRAEKSEYPERLVLLGLFSLFMVLIWSVCVLVYFSLKDRR
jgi:capsular polysaccharide transport system permease protein